MREGVSDGNVEKFAGAPASQGTWDKTNKPIGRSLGPIVSAHFNGHFGSACSISGRTRLGRFSSWNLLLRTCGWTRTRLPARLTLASG
jgi:hypothetical protein